MNIETLTTFLGWCTFLNFLLLIFSTLICVLAADWVYRAHSKWFSISRDSFNITIYAFIAFYKTLIIVFNIIPYLALSIIK